MKTYFLLFIFLFSLYSFAREDEIVLLHITDLHIDFIGLMYPNSKAFVSKLGEIINKVHASLVIISGDIVEFGEGIFAEHNYLLLKSMFFKSNDVFYVDDKFKVPVYFIPGNHEYHTIFKITCNDIPNYRHFVGNEFYSFIHENTLFCMLNTGYDYYWKPFEYGSILPDPEGSGLGREQLKFLESTLSSGSNLVKVVVTHHPPINYERGIEDGIFLGNKEFLELCYSYGVNLFISGHTHKDKIYILDDAGIKLLKLSEPSNLYYHSLKGIFIQTPSFGWDGSYRVIKLGSNYVKIYPVEKINLDN